VEAAKLRDQSDRGRRCRITEKVLDDAFEYLEEQCIDTFKHSSVHDAEGHLTIRLHMKALDDLKEYLRFSITNGEDARKALIKTLANTEETHAPRKLT